MERERGFSLYKIAKVSSHMNDSFSLPRNDTNSRKRQLDVTNEVESEEGESIPSRNLAAQMLLSYLT